ncbi:MAG: ClpXP protease specificity-enhancing factor [Gammaproteobacteria bacterium]|jgi:stringent starvation protein B
MMTSQKPYLVRAFFDWIVDNKCNPYLVVQADYPKTRVPQEYVDKNGQIVFNISPGIVRDLQLGDKYITFAARFSGVKQNIYIPIQAVVAIYAKENSQGMVFEAEEPEVMEDDGSSSGSGIKVIK